MASKKNTAKAKARLAKLGKKAPSGSDMELKKRLLRTKVRMGDRKTRNAAARELNKMPRIASPKKPKQQN